MRRKEDDMEEIAREKERKGNPLLGGEGYRKLRING